MRKARDAPINVIDVYAKDQMGQAQQVRATMGTSSQTQPKPVDLASIEVTPLPMYLFNDMMSSNKNSPAFLFYLSSS
jgi:hypothetical protein